MNDNSRKILIVTTTFNEEIDYKYIKHVFHIFDHYSLITIDQQIDRAGRNNENATSTIFVSYNYLSNRITTKVNRNLNENDIFSIDNQMYHRFLLEKKCLKRVLDFYFENKITKSCTTNQN